ncbi:MAG: T9SS type A sorting domain-containing protein, partial [Bacteroidota bacterium]
PLMRVNVTGFYPLNTKLSIQQGRVLVVDFPDANLAIFEANPSKAVGFVEYQLELLNPLSNGTVINNRAFVDYDSKWIGYSQNCGVVLTDLLSVKSINKGLDVVLSPNPVSDELKVSGSAKLMGKPWIIYNASGQQVASGTINAEVIMLNTGKFSSGIYSFTVNGVAQKFQVLR